MRLLKSLLAVVAVLATAAPAASLELLMYRRAGCPYCLAFDREIGPIYAKTDIGKRVALRHVDVERDAAPVALVSPVRFTPTFVLVENGRELARIEGYPGEFFFWGLLEKLLLQPGRTLKVPSLSNT